MTGSLPCACRSRCINALADSVYQWSRGQPHVTQTGAPSHSAPTPLNYVPLTAAEMPIPADAEPTLAKVARRIVPFLWLLYVLGYLDRINISFGRLTMLHDLGLNEAQYGLASGIFYLGYCIFEVPSNLILER